MNNLKPYEKHLADKLQQVPVPDKDEGWKEMRKLLDRDLPEGGAGWGGNRKWWWMGITVAIIIVGLWTSQQFSEREKARSNEALANSNGTSIDKINPGSTTTDNNEAAETSKKNTGSINEPASSITSTLPVNDGEKNPESKNSAAYTNSSGKKEGVTHEGELTKNKATAVDFPVKKEEMNNTTTPKKTPSSKATKNGLPDVTNLQARNGATTAIGTLALGSQQRNTNKKNPNSGKSGKGIDESVSNESETSILHQAPEQKTLISSSIKPVGMEDYAFQDPSKIYIDLPASIDPLKAEPGKTDKAFAKEMRKKSIKDDNRKMSGKSMRGVGVEKDHELTFAAGLALPQSFAIGSQQSPAYGINAKPGKLSDYIPVPFFQYHVNTRLFMQTELQFQAPQFTDRLLVYSAQKPIMQTGSMLERNIFVEKLYYFHIPFNVYYSPARNFYVGSGLQFSSLLSGVATYQDTRYTGGTIDNSQSRTQGFKDDSIASKLTSSEWRYQFDANYYFKRLTLGARYNQALTQFVNLQPGALMPYTQGRNQSFLIYLRYNIWEERKKNSYYTANNW